MVVGRAFAKRRQSVAPPSRRLARQGRNTFIQTSKNTPIEILLLCMFWYVLDTFKVFMSMKRAFDSETEKRVFILSPCQSCYIRTELQTLRKLCEQKNLKISEEM